MAFFGGGGASVANMAGATSSAAGTAGLCPAPAAGEEKAFLCGDATFKGVVFAQKLFNWGDTRYFVPIGAGDGTSGTTIGGFVTTSRLNPIILPACSINELACLVASSSSNGTGYLALYDSDSNGLPKNLLASGSFSHVNAESNVWKLVSISPAVSIKAGLYWTAYSHSSGQTGSVYRNAKGNPLFSFSGILASGTNPASTTIEITLASAGTWPNPITSTSNTTNPTPLVIARGQ